MAEKISMLISEQEVADRIVAMAAEISEAYRDKDLHLICVLKGGAFFMTELSKHLSIPCSLDFMALSSYRDGTKSSGNVKIVKDLDEPITGRDVLVVEDIVDSGHTLNYLSKWLNEQSPRSLKLCTLLDKPDRREVSVHVDYIGFQIPDAFVVGYGLDYQQKYRNLPFIGVVEL